MVDISILIRDRKGTETTINMVYEDESDAVYMWSVGNYSCDCNRGLFLHGDDCECGEKQFGVTLISGDKEVIYSDLERLGKEW